MVSFLLLTNTACATSVPVMVGGEKYHDACGSAAKTISSEKQRVKVYSAPEDEADVIDEISKSIYVAVCDFDNDPFGNWVGIVYSFDGKLNCGVGTPILKRTPYSGTCRSGWVKKANLKNWIG